MQKICLAEVHRRLKSSFDINFELGLDFLKKNPNFSYRKYVFSIALNFCIQNVFTIFVLRISKLVDFSNRHRNKTTLIRAGKSVMRILMAINNNFCWCLWQSLITHCNWNCFLPFRGHPYMTSNFGLMDILIYQNLSLILRLGQH